MNTAKLLLIIGCIVSTHTWDTCDDREFCKKIRNKEPKHHFNLLLNTVVTTNTSLQADLQNNQTKQLLQFKITGLQSDIFRIQITEYAKRRFTAHEALDNPLESGIKILNQRNDLTIQNGGTKATINASPFTINVYTKHLGVTINEGGGMEYVSEVGDDAIAMDFKFRGANTAYGIPEHLERLALKSSGVGGRNPYRLYNVDNLAKDVESPESVYGAVPVLYAHGTKHTSGVFWMNYAQTFVDINTTVDEVNAFFISESGAMDMFILPGPTLEASVKQYHTLTGTAPLPPLFSMGYHQSRYSYMTQSDLEGVVSNLDANDYPVDVVWLDIDYTDGKKYFTWNLTAFPAPLEMQTRLASTGRKLVVIIDPHIKVEKGYHVYDQALRRGFFVRNENGSVFEGNCWPGRSSYIDFINPAAREWWSQLFAFENFPNTSSIVHIWNDMNEPSVFDVHEQTMRNTLRHSNNWMHRDVHNIYGLTQTMGTHEGMILRGNNNTRPFILTRSHFAGSQRYTAIWTGDNSARWDHMQISIPMCLTSSLAGISFCGADVGGFVENPSEELFQRWYQLGAWLPFFRAHSSSDTIRREPYLYSQEIQARFRRAIKERYAHLPYWYTAFYEHERFGRPVMRTMSYHYQEEEETLSMDNQFMVGADIMVCPVLLEGATRLKVYLPTGLWYKLEENKAVLGPTYYSFPVAMDYSPVFYRGGSIIPRKDTPRKSTAYMTNDPYNLYVFLDQNRSAIGNLYVDDYQTFNYRTYKQYNYMEYQFNNGVLSSRKIDSDAVHAPIVLNEIIIYGWNTTYSNAVVDDGVIKTGREIDVTYDGKAMMISGLDIDISKEFKIKFR